MLRTTCTYSVPCSIGRILKSTFGDEEVYTRSLLTPNQAQDFLATMTRKPWLKPYRWGVQEAAKLPCSYLLLKQKKNFLKARPIISYKSFAFGRLFQAASSALNMMLPVVFPNSYGHQSLPEIFQGLHQYLSNVDEDIELMEAVNHLIDSYAALQSTEFSKIKFTVQLGASEPKLRTFQGSYKRHRSKTGTIFLRIFLESVNFRWRPPFSLRWEGFLSRPEAQPLATTFRLPSPTLLFLTRNSSGTTRIAALWKFCDRRSISFVT